MGDKKAAVNIWQWKASDNLAVEFNAQGPSALTQQEKQDIQVVPSYKEGMYRIMFKRALQTGDKDDTAFEVGKFTPFAVALYDGRNDEENNKGAISAWYFMELEPPTPVKVYVLPPIAFIAVFGIGLVLRKSVKKKGLA
jgi:DMSO reductase family type II enzyme heme b subunit